MLEAVKRLDLVPTADDEPDGEPDTNGEPVIDCVAELELDGEGDGDEDADGKSETKEVVVIIFVAELVDDIVEVFDRMPVVLAVRLLGRVCRGERVVGEPVAIEDTEVDAVAIDVILKLPVALSILVETEVTEMSAVPDDEPVPTVETVPIVDTDSVSVPRPEIVLVAHVERVDDVDARRVISAE